MVWVCRDVATGATGPDDAGMVRVTGSGRAYGYAMVTVLVTMLMIYDEVSSTMSVADDGYGATMGSGCVICMGGAGGCGVGMVDGAR